jgi:hypothetical protein
MSLRVDLFSFEIYEDWRKNHGYGFTTRNNRDRGPKQYEPTYNPPVLVSQSEKKRPSPVGEE